MRRSPSGNTLMITLIALAVLMLLVAAAIQFTGTNNEAAIAKSRGDDLQACADTARKLIVAKLRTFPGANAVSTSNLTLNTRIPDEQTGANDKLTRTAHIGSSALEPVIVKLSATAMGSSRYQARDVANTLAQSTLGGEYYRVVVSCKQPTTGAESEVEFTFRHGL